MIQVRPDAAVDPPIVMTIMLLFIGLALLGMATVRATPDRSGGMGATVRPGGGLIAAPFYTFDKVVHFILLGLLWGSAWMYMALVGYRYTTTQAPTRPASVPIEVA